MFPGKKAATCMLFCEVTIKSTEINLFVCFDLSSGK